MKERSSTNRLMPTGFTIVELLIVIVVIAIIAAITVVAYNGITKSAVESSMQSDLEAARNSIAIMKAGKKNYPTDASAANDGQGLKASGNNQLSYGSSGSDYFVAVTNPATDKKFCLATGKISECAGAIVTTFAGTSTYNDVHDGTGSGASFGWPTSVAIDNDGDLFVGDCGSALRKITPSGLVTTFAGSNTTSGYVDGDGSAARFTCLQGVAIDSSGAIYVSNYGYSNFNGIRKVTPTGTVSTLAGSVTRGNVDGTGTAAQFSDPYGLAIDSSGNVYVADAGANDTIRKITPSGVVTTFAGSTTGYADGTGSAAQFSNPHGVAVDESGNVFVADSDNRRIRKITPAGEVSTFAGSGTDGRVDGTGTAAQFGYPTGLTVDKDGNLYVADNSPHTIRKITPEGVVTTVAGEGTYGYIDAIGSSARFGWMDNGIAVDASGVLYVADSDYYTIRKIVP